MIINVDDLGLSPAVNEAVVTLAEKKRIQSTSFMSFGSIDSTSLSTLQRQNVDIGLHLDFTELVKLFHDFGSLKQLILAAWSRKLSKERVAFFINKQLDLFEDKIGLPPIFIDGHQHIHQFPVIRETLLDLAQKRYGHSVAMRSTKPIENDVKSQIIYVLGGRCFNRLCENEQLNTNHRFSGVYGFDADYDALKELWRRWIVAASCSGDLIMCHPAVIDDGWSDSIKKAREIEFSWLSSDEFGAVLDGESVELESWGCVFSGGKL